ncbi:rab-like protein 3 [Drosophila serrata]|uniref:rab-like protein 3 n=1 Tax=Drosophila serrata TaxID=7274 RepID=UPI000A1CF3E7|nr:rab-like protein 3 [Drosophila serrata]
MALQKDLERLPYFRFPVINRETLLVHLTLNKESPKKMAEKQLQVNDVPTVRILMLGDKGVGKTSVTNLMACSIDTPTLASRSVKHRYWDIQVRLHEYIKTEVMPPTPDWTSHSSSEDKSLFPPQRKPTKTEILYFVEFIDIITECRLQRAQYKDLTKDIDGIVLVHNLENMRSQDNLHDWLYEPLRQICKQRHGRHRPILKTHHVPILVVGTRLDKMPSPPVRRRSGIAHQLNADEMFLNCLDVGGFEENSRTQEQMRRFFDRVVEFKEKYPLWGSNTD